MLKRFILWDYARGTWQYDVMVGIIVVFVLATPRGWFRDQPRTPQVSSIAVLPAGHGSSVYWLEPEPFASLSQEQRVQKVSELLRKFTRRQNVTIIRLEPVQNSEGETKGYMVFAKP
jgi:hypothetical protein